jgi:hypothetical protein
MEFVRRDTTCKRCLKTFPIEEFRVGKHGRRITYCVRCSEMAMTAQRKLLSAIEEGNKQRIVEGEKVCPRCRAIKDLDAFKDGRGYVRRVCVPCREYMTVDARKRRSKWSKEKRAEKYEKINVIKRALRLEVIAAYGGHCKCCGESTLEFLAIDHVNGDGGAHRRSIKESAKGGDIPAYEFYNWLKNNGYPGGFQILCHNCNVAKGMYGTCPHRKNPLLLVETLGLGPMVVKSSGAPRKLVN